MIGFTQLMWHVISLTDCKCILEGYNTYISVVFASSRIQNLFSVPESSSKSEKVENSQNEKMMEIFKDGISMIDDEMLNGKFPERIEEVNSLVARLSLSALEALMATIFEWDTWEDLLNWLENSGY